jgi:Tfp pilus assembly protein FimV
MCPDGFLRPVREAPAQHEETQAMRARIADLEAQVTAAEAVLQRHGLSVASEQAGPSRTSPQPQDQAEEMPGPASTAGHAGGTVIAEGGQLTLGDEPGSSFFFGGAGSHFLWVSLWTLAIR